MNTKKTYQTPHIRVTRLKMQYHLLAASEIGVGSGTKSASESLSRQGSFWDDEEDEEE